MASEQENRMNEPLGDLVAGVPGQEILQEFKKCLKSEPVFKKLFGNDGERIIIDKAVSINTKAIPLFELRWKTDTYKSFDTYLEGQIEGRMIFPINLKADNFNVKRKISLMFARFVGSERFELFDKVAGLLMFGQDMNINYSVAFGVSGNSLPGILINIPYRLDLHKWYKAHPEIDPLEALDGEEFDVTTYVLEHQVEDDDEIKTVFNSEISNEE